MAESKVEVEEDTADVPPRSAAVEVEREVTKRHLIEAVTSVVIVILYMAFSLLQSRDRGVVTLGSGSPDDDWAEK